MALVLLPGHALLAWGTWKGTGEFKHLETTAIGRAGFKQACTEGEERATFYQGETAEAIDRDHRLRPMSRLRALHRVFTME